MFFSTLRYLIACGFIACLWNGFAQEPNATGPLVYESFFREVAQLQRLGQNGGPPRIAPQQAIGLTDQESRVLDDEAFACEADSAALDKSLAPLVLESRLMAIESGQASDWLEKQMGLLRTKREQMTEAHIEKLRRALGEERFLLVDSFVHRTKMGNSFFPPPPGTPVLIKK